MALLAAATASTKDTVAYDADERSSSFSSFRRCPPMAPSHWPHRPVFVQVGRDMTVRGQNTHNDDPLPLGVPVDFESPLFRGRMLFRLRNSPTNDPSGHDAYFADRKRVMQTVVQGQFKTSVPMNDLFAGGIFRQPLKHAPPPFFMRFIKMMCDRIAPGTQMDLTGVNPRVLSLLAGSVQTLSIDPPGHEPDITAVEIPENTDRIFHGRFKSIKERKKKMSVPKVAAEYHFDTENIHTFHLYDDSVDYGNCAVQLPLYGKFKLALVLGPQPMNLTMVTSSGESMCDFDVWHESIYKKS